MNEEKNLDDSELDDEETDSVSGGSQKKWPRRVTFQCNNCGMPITLELKDAWEYAECNFLFCSNRFRIKVGRCTIRDYDGNVVSNAKWEY